MKKIKILISGEVEFPDYMERAIEMAIKDNFIQHLPSMVQPPLILRYTGVQKVEEQ